MSPSSGINLPRSESNFLAVLARYRQRLVVSLVMAFGLASEASAAGEVAQVDSQTAAFLSENCLRCHGPEKAKGGLRLDQLDADLSTPATFDRWREIVGRVQSGEMPPKKEQRPKPAEVTEVVGRLSARLDKAAAGAALRGPRGAAAAQSRGIREHRARPFRRQCVGEGDAAGGRGRAGLRQCGRGAERLAGAHRALSRSGGCGAQCRHRAGSQLGEQD